MKSVNTRELLTRGINISMRTAEEKASLAHVFLILKIEMKSELFQQVFPVKIKKITRLTIGSDGPTEFIVTP